MTTIRALFLVIFSSAFLVLLPPCTTHTLQTCGFDAIYQLGDSVSDTGNLIREDPSSVYARLPYGATFFKNATGRCSNGLIMIDYLARSAGIPFLDAYLNENSTHSSGVDFAVAGATALPVEILARRNITATVTNSSLTMQLDWMFTHFNTTCETDKGCFKKHRTALFMVGEIGANDYNYALFEGKNLEEIRAMVPEVVQAIKDAAERVIDYGGSRLVIPGNFPTGCLPMFLTVFQTNDTTAYDKFHCLKDLNNLSIYHNNHLKKAIEELRKEHPNVIIVYGNNYQAYHWLLSKAKILGFDTGKACCGIGGDYNFSIMKMCGAAGVPVCSNPDKHLSWDGAHLTQEAYKFMATWLIHDIYPKLQCQSST
ncbi:hypothetical protein SCA6_018248 [Theobroma cacao]